MVWYLLKHRDNFTFTFTNLKERDHGETGTDGNVISCWEVVDCIQLAQDRDQWRNWERDNKPSGSVKGGECLD